MPYRDPETGQIFASPQEAERVKASRAAQFGFLGDVWSGITGALGGLGGYVRGAEENPYAAQNMPPEMYQRYSDAMHIPNQDPNQSYQQPPNAALGGYMEGPIGDPSGDPLTKEGWLRFVQSGGVKQEFVDPKTGAKTVIKNVPPKDPFLVAKDKQNKVQAQGSPQAVQQSMQAGAQLAATQPPGRPAPQQAAPKPPAPQQAAPQQGPPPSMAPPGGENLLATPTAPTVNLGPQADPSGIGGYPMDPAAQRLQAANTPYARRFGPGEEPLSAPEFEKRQRALINERAAEQERLLMEGSPEKAALLARAYDRINKRTGTGTKILLGVLSGNPFWVDTMAAYEADEEAKEARYTSEQRKEISKKKYDELMTLLTSYEERLEKRKKEVGHEVSRMLETNPGMRYSKDWNRDMAIAMGTPAERVDQFLEDHYDPRTGEYNLVKDPREEAIIRIKNDANVIKSLNPHFSDEVAIASAKHPELWLKMVTDGEMRYETMSRDPNRTAEERAAAARLAEGARISKTRAHDKGYIKLYDLESIRGTDTIWNNMNVDQKKKWGKDYLQALEEYFGASPGRDSEDVYLKRRLETAHIKGADLDNLQKAQIVAAGGKIGGSGTGKDKEKRPSNIYQTIALKNNPVLSHGKPSANTVTEAYRQQDMLIMGMINDEIPKGDTPGEKEIRSRADTVKQEVWNYFTPPAKNTFKELSYDEAAVIAQLIYKVQADPEAFYNPDMNAIYEFLRQYRVVKENNPKQRKKFLGIF